MNISKQEVLRYLGYRGSQPDDRIDQLVQSCILQMTQIATPRYIEERFELRLHQNHICIGTLETDSSNLARNLAGCREVVLLAATLGVGVDQLLRREALTGVTRAAVLQAVAAAAIEAVCDEHQRELDRLVGQEGLFLRPRFSPGYGDFDITCQQPLLQLLQAPKRIGLTLTQSMMLAPTKSVTAIIGLSPNDLFCPVDGCESCTKADCAYKRS